MSERLKETANRLKLARERQRDETELLIQIMKNRKDSTEDEQEKAQHDVRIANAENVIVELEKEIEELSQIAG